MAARITTIVWSDVLTSRMVLSFLRRKVPNHRLLNLNVLSSVDLQEKALVEAESLAQSHLVVLYKVKPNTQQAAWCPALVERSATVATVDRVTAEMTIIKTDGVDGLPEAWAQYLSDLASGASR